MKLALLFSIFIMNQLSFASDEENLDKYLSDFFPKFGITNLPPSSIKTQALINLGRLLFQEKLISGPKTTSCSSCHDPQKSTGDQKRLAEGFNGKILQRHTPPLFNLGFPSQNEYFWDGRASLKIKPNGKRIFKSPDAGLNGERPQLAYIAESIDDALALQALFPMINSDEMKGYIGNEIAEAPNNEIAWSRIVQRIISANQYQAPLQLAYPSLRLENVNIGHLASAISAFISSEFRVDKTPFDQYLGGDFKALTSSQKNGLKIFMTKGQCVACHFGPHLSGFEFKSVGVPQISTTFDSDDLGRYPLSHLKQDKYAFKTPGLRNIALTAPYMHDGVYGTLEEVIEHYNQTDLFLNSFLKLYKDPLLFVDLDLSRNQARFDSISTMGQKMGLNLTQEDKNDLLDFLNNGLTQK